MNAIKILFLVVATISLSACTPQTTQDQKSFVVNTDEIQVYYFHLTKRCATCNAVENETKVVLENNYANKMKEGKIVFTSLNLEEEEGKKMAEQLKVSGQTLLLVKGDKMVNLTNDGFMNARTKPDKFHEILNSNIDNLL